MLRGSQLVISSCPFWSHLRLNGSNCTRARWHLNARHEGVIGRLIFNSHCDNERRQEASFQNLKSTESPWKHNKTVNSQDCLSSTTSGLPRKRFRDICHPSHRLRNTNYCRHFCYTQKAVNALQWLENVRTRAQAYSLSSHQTTAVRGVWSECLTLENENRCRRNLEPNLKLYNVANGRWASILVSLCSLGGEVAFLFTLRSSMLQGRHKGDVSFAGGKSDASDSDVVATALREAREELGIHVSTESVWGVLKPLKDTTGMLVAPVLANVGPLEKLSFRPNPGEVEEIFSLSLSHLCDPQNRGYTHFRTGGSYGYTLPVFRNGKHRVWGLTAVALDHTLKLLIPSHML